MDNTEVVFVPTYKKKWGKTKLIICLVAILATGLFLDKKAQANPPLYGVAIFQSGGIGSKKATPVAYVLKSLNSSEVGRKLIPIKNYVGVYFDDQNQMWAYCKDGYGVIDASSSTGNPIYNEPTIGSTQFKVGIKILDQSENTLQIACEKL